MSELQLSIEGMEEALRTGLANSDFADEIEDIEEWMTDEDLVAAVGQQQGLRSSGLRGMDSLTERLAELAAKTTGTPPEASAPDVASSPEPGEHVQQELIAA